MNFKLVGISNSVPGLAVSHIFEAVIAVTLFFWVVWVFHLTVLSIRIMQLKTTLGSVDKSSKLKLRQLIGLNSSALKKSPWALLIPSILIFFILTITSISNLSAYSINSVNAVARHEYVATVNISEKSQDVSFNRGTDLAIHGVQAGQSDEKKKNDMFQSDPYLTLVKYLSCGLSGVIIGELIRVKQRRQLKIRKFGQRIWQPSGLLREFEYKAVGINYRLYDNLKRIFGIMEKATCLEKLLPEIRYFEIDDKSARFYLLNLNLTEWKYGLPNLSYDPAANTVSVNLTDLSDTDYLNFSFDNLFLGFVCIQFYNNTYTFVNGMCKRPVNLYGDFGTLFIQNVILECATSILCRGINEVNLINFELESDDLIDLMNLKVVLSGVVVLKNTRHGQKCNFENTLVIINNLNGEFSELNDRFKGEDLSDLSCSGLIVLNSESNSESKYDLIGTLHAEESECSDSNTSLKLNEPLKISEVDIANLNELIAGLSSSCETIVSEAEIDLRAAPDSQYEELIDDEPLIGIGKLSHFEEKVFESVSLDFLGLSDGDVLVKVLGRVEVQGTSTVIDKVRLLESIVYIALHPNGVDKTIWATAIWPDQLLTRDSLNTAVWQIRRSLGTNKDGSKHMPPSYNGILKFADSVFTDYELFRKLGKSELESDLEKAMSLITGRAFEGLQEPNWITLEGYLSDIESRIVDTCVQLVFKKSKSRQYDVAEWALRRALLAVPYDERLWRYLLITYSKSDNLSKLESVMNEIAFTMEDDSEVYTGISDETFRLYRQLSGKEFPRRRLRQNKQENL
jgi:DNA-binding SARP family transcriptional activator